MSASFVVPDVVRLPRTTVARRALLVVCFLGGFLVLACVFGGQAHAAEGESAGSGGQVLTGSQSGGDAGERLGASVRESVTGVPHAAGRDVRRTDAAADPALKPVVDATDGAAGPVGDVVKPVTDLPEKLSAGLGSQQGAGAAHDSGWAGAVAPGAGADRLWPRAATSDVPASPATGTARPGATAHAVQPVGGRGADHRAPLDDPATPSLPTSQSTSGNSSPRGADQRATLPSDRMGFVLTAGAVSSVTVAPTCERSGDVLEFPA